METTRLVVYFEFSLELKLTCSESIHKDWSNKNVSKYKMFVYNIVFTKVTRTRKYENH